MEKQPCSRLTASGTEGSELSLCHRLRRQRNSAGPASSTHSHRRGPSQRPSAQPSENRSLLIYPYVAWATFELPPAKVGDRVRSIITLVDQIWQRESERTFASERLDAIEKRTAGCP